MKETLAIYCMLLVLQALLFQFGQANIALTQAVCAANATKINCKKWTLISSWTQGGYYAACKRNLSANYLTVFIVRNLYRCKNGNLKQNVVKIVNSYFDGEGKLCHLSHGDKVCPGISASTKSNDKHLIVSLYCGDFACRFRYHRCDLCPLAPWYTWTTVSDFNRRKRCNDRSFFWQKEKKRSRRGLCVKCDGSAVDNSFCTQRKTIKYYVDLARSKPSWSRWLQAAECRSNKTKPNCGNGTAPGTTSWTKRCRYADNPVKLNPKFCGPPDNNVNLTCDIKLQPCHVKAVSQTNTFLKRARAWLIVLAVFFVVAFIIAIWIYFKYLRLKSKTDGNSYAFLATGIFSTCATQTSPNYSPRRIMCEPEYALLGDWRHNVAKYPQIGIEYSFSEDGNAAYSGSDHHLLSDDHLSDSNEENESIINMKNGTVENRSRGRRPANERCELEASKRRAFFAKSSSSSAKLSR